jgi:hypothetical protein
MGYASAVGYNPTLGLRAALAVDRHAQALLMETKQNCPGLFNGMCDSNIQVADLNAFNACLAVIKWKKLLGFCYDHDQEHHSLYTIDGNHLMNVDLS